MDSPVDKNHLGVLVNILIESYCKIRLHHFAKQNTPDNSGSQIKSQLTKLIHFKNQ